MMNRRKFVARLSSALAVIGVAPALTLEAPPKSVNTGVNTEDPEVDLDRRVRKSPLIALQEHLQAYCDRHRFDVRVLVEKAPHASVLRLHFIDRRDSRNAQRAAVSLRAVPYSKLLIIHGIGTEAEQQRRLVIRTIKYQTVKCVDVIRRVRETGQIEYFDNSGLLRACHLGDWPRISAQLFE
jgi:hypothetical protein